MNIEEVDALGIADESIRPHQTPWHHAISGRWRRFWRQLQALRRVARRLTPYVQTRRGSLALALGATIGYMLLRLVEPWPLKLIFDHIVLRDNMPPALAVLESWGHSVALGVLVGSIVAVAMCSGFLYYWQNVLAAHIGQQVVAGLRLELFRHLQRLDFTFHDRRQTGDLLVRLVADIRLLRDALIKIPLDMSENSLLMIGMGVVMLIMDWRLALLSFAVLPLLFVLVHRFRRPMRAVIRQQRRQEGDLASMMSESLGAVRLVQGLGLEEQEAMRMGGPSSRSVKEGVKSARLEARLRCASELAVGLVTAVVIAVAARRILAGALSPGDLVVFVVYMRTFARPLRRISRTTEQMTRTVTAGERIIEILDLLPGVADAPDAVEAPIFRGEIRFEGAALRYGRYPWSLRDIDLTIRPGERVGIVGPTGAGKSSLVSLVPRFYDATEGRVLIDRRNVCTMTLASLRRQISFVFQEPMLFAMSVADNIAAGLPGASREDIEQAARRAGIHEVIGRLAEGYDTVLGERGGTLSGGERQCVSIARAILRDAPIVILDEPTTGLDQRSATMVLAALQRLMEGRTVLMISHDLQRLRDLDRIVVLERGRQVQEGTYAQLVAREGLFSELVGHATAGRVR